MTGGAIGVVQIAEGCLGSCRYCITRQARGRLRSQPEDVISATVRMLVKQGAREVQLTAQDVASWGIDRGQCLRDLLSRLLDLPGSFRLRLGMMNPRTLLPIIDDLIPLLSHPKMYQFVHVPFQSGSDEILTAMDRRYTKEQCLSISKKLRTAYPNLWLSTDIIACFPGENEAAFHNTVDLIKAIRPDKVNSTRFSRRPGTAAWSLPDMLERVKKVRSRLLTEQCTAIGHQRNRLWIGRTLPVVAVEEVKRGSVTCRTQEYRSVVIHEPLLIGGEGTVRVTGERTHFLTGELLEAREPVAPQAVIPGARTPTSVSGVQGGPGVPGQ